MSSHPCAEHQATAKIVHLCACTDIVFHLSRKRYALISSGTYAVSIAPRFPPALNLKESLSVFRVASRVLRCSQSYSLLPCPGLLPPVPVPLLPRLLSGFSLPSPLLFLIALTVSAHSYAWHCVLRNSELDSTSSIDLVALVCPIRLFRPCEH